MSKGDIWQVTASNGLYVRSGPSTSYSIVGGLSYGSTVVEIESTNGWIKHSSGYSSGTYLKLKQKAATQTTTTTNPEPVDEKTTQTVNEESGNDTSGYKPDVEEIMAVSGAREFEDIVSDKSSFYDINNVVGVFGLPYQFLPSADPRTRMSSPFKGNDTGIGMEYADRIVAKIPLLFMAPGRPNFMSRYSKDEKDNLMASLIESFTGIDNTQTKLEELLESDGRYYTFQYDTNEYYHYVNPMCRMAAIYLGIQNVSLGSWTLGTMDWGKYTIGSTIALNSATTFAHIPFYLDTDTSISEDFGNSLTESSLASTVNGISDMAREINFLTGYTSEALDSDWLSQNTDVASHMQNINDMVNSILGHNSFLTNLSKHLTSVASGGKLIFPKIWSDSDFSRSYNVKIKLTSPDCNKLSIFLNILVPLFHLLGFVSPQTMPENPNGYTSPFIVRAIYKSFFNVDMGIITSMSVDKGGDCQWTVDGLPTSIEVSLTIKDLYEAMGITKSGGENGWKYDTLSNTAQMDYIANLCGINMYKPEIGRQLTMWLYNNGTKVVDVPRDIWRNINQSIGSAINTFFRRY